MLISGTAAAKPDVTIAIIIDDMGNNLTNGRRALSLPGTFTYSVLPYATYSDVLAKEAAIQNKEIMLHLPMANVNNKPLGPGALTVSLTQDEFLKTVRTAIERVPQVSGINNHMGSLLTSQMTEMKWLMTELKRRNLYFIDSRTTTSTVAETVAIQQQLDTDRRDVFLDNEQNFAAIDASFQRLLMLAHRNGSAIAIGHPHRATLEYLEAVIPTLDRQKIKLTTVSELLKENRKVRVAEKPAGGQAAF